MVETSDLLNASVWTLFSALLGILIAIVSAVLVPIIVDKLTPDIKEREELKKGNVAVANYMGQIVMGVTIGISIIIAAAIIAGVHGP
ncbi:DUF350 domain-containing protein [Candidatus Micrarchaeota archaeon]|nr:DUF350 domain-containing protein [Candidatus Micrarchaeota archaeon]